MISTRALLAARLDSTGNELLAYIYANVNFFNSGAVASADRGDYLERLLVAAGSWLTSHPPKNTPTNTARWKAMEQLADEIAAEAQRLGIRFLAGPSNWKEIGKQVGANPHNVKRSYWLEMLSPQHGVGFQLSPLFKDWAASGNQALSFWDYARLNPPWGAKYVTYFSAQQAETYRVRFKPDRKLYRVHDDSLYDTDALETCASGPGWAIFVVSPKGDMYSHKHVEGVFHHSSFLGGSAVMAAGEVLVVNGEVRIINSKSGHYLPIPENMHNMVKVFPYLPNDAIILPDFKTNPPPAYRIKEFRFNPKSPKSVKRAQLEKLLTPNADNGMARGWINKVAA